MNLKAAAKGITLKNLDENLKAEADVKLSNVAFPLNDRDGFSILRFFMLPVSFIPRLIDALPEPSTRLYLQKNMGNQLDILSGRKNTTLERGRLLFHSAETGRHTDMIVDKAYFLGPDIQVISKKTMFNPFHNELDMSTETVIGSIRYPLHVTGTLENPEIDVNLFLLNFLHANLLSGAEPFTEEQLESSGPGKKKADPAAKGTGPAGNPGQSGQKPQQP